MTPATLVREARPDDAAGLSVLLDAYRQFYACAPDLPRARAFIDDRLRRQDSVLLVAERDGDLAGFTQLYPTLCTVEAAPIYVLYDLFVHPGSREHGVGRTLLRAAAERGRRDGVVRMDLSTATTNTTAQALYASEGWLRDDEFHHYSLTLR
ncbi:GNAT family N-acetyltransferase [Pimelobacter simplex]|uniref:GNAT family N-acetyltransferase n=1 Tax=Nocardioides simplex TaxID=2045 RepID=UPI0005361C5B|nr:GNAT family N-acetyltransferase [Pimelobacter simplex]MCG8149388.1 GNAT family N-acetyltransferase [Pimelobacter simplex]GEB16486.1 N-acetyltransferase [Pimelobacter simplex]SFM19739.1 Ribosomal protein S18 acetylase RimI [Pimelobacter simplex]